MKIDLTTVLNGRADRIIFDKSFDAKESEGYCMFPDGIDITSPVRVVGEVTDKNGCMFLNARVSVSYHTLCDRCLADIDRTFSFDFERMILPEEDAAARGGGLDDARGDSDDSDDSIEEILYVKESGVFPEESIIEDAALEIPPYHLCRDDCAGLCPRCGKNLNDGACGCGEKKEIHPELKKLQKLLDNFE